MNEIEQIKERIDIVDLIGQYVSLRKAGANFKGLCPFHHERTPSLMVNPERRIFKCFGCDKGGDIFSFMQEIEGLSFGDVLKILADRAGVSLTPKPSPRPGEAPSEKSRYYSINAFAAQFFHRLLVEHSIGAEARAYLKGRRINDQTVRLWRIGYAPSKKVLTALLVKKGFKPAEIQAAGKPDMFYDRIMFPILDVMGNTVGFTGRILGPGEPKYLNTPETPIFRKSRILFGLEKARQTIKQQGQVIVAEGQMDVISAAQAGTANVVATSGTALTQEHLRILARYDADIVFAFDTDSAGIAATKRGIDLAIADGLSVKVIPLPDPFQDIGDVVLADPAQWLALVKQPVPAVEWEIETVLAPYRTQGISRKLSVDEKKAVAKALLPVLRRIPDTIEQAHYIQLLAKRLEVREQTIQTALNRIVSRTASLAQPGTVPAAAEHQQSTPLNTAEALLGLLERFKDWQTTQAALYAELKKWYNKPVNELLMRVEEHYRGLAPAELKRELELLISRYHETEMDVIKSNFASRISQAESTGDRALVKKLLIEFQDLIKR